MLLILCSWIIITTVLLAFGEMSITLWSKAVGKEDDKPAFFDKFWLGLCIVGMLVCIITLFLPVNTYVLGCFILLSALYWLFNIQKAKRICSSAYQGFVTLRWWNKMILVFIFLSLIIYTLTIPYLNTVYDIGLYHLQSLMWTEQYSVVPGLGNLHGRLSFNSNSLLFHSLFSYHPDYYPAFLPFAGLCLFVFSGWLIKTANDLKSNIHSIILYTIILVFYFIMRRTVQTSSTDLLANIFVMYIILNIALSKRNDMMMLVLSVMSIFCITLKLSSAPILLTALWCVVFYFREKKIKQFWIVALLGVFIIIPWCTRFVIMSGYLVYPFPGIDIFGFDWKMPIEYVINEKNAVYTWARVQNTDYEALMAMPWYGWIPTWMHFQDKLTLALFALSFASPLLILSGLRVKDKGNMIIAWFIAFCGVVFGFFSAPDIRFSIGPVLCSGLIAFLLVFLLLEGKWKSLDKKLKCTGLALSFSFILFVVLAVRQTYYYKDADESFLSLVLEPQTIDYAKKWRETTCTEREINNGIIYTSNKYDQCFDVCFPCAPPSLRYDRLEMRGDSFQDGFRMKK